MLKNKRETLAIVLDNGVANQACQEIIDALPRGLKLVLLNSRFVSDASGERIKTDSLLNLSSRKEIDVWYKDILREHPEFIEAKADAEADEARAILQAAAQEQKDAEAALIAKGVDDEATAKKAIEDKVAAEVEAVARAKKDVAQEKKTTAAAKPKTVKK